MIEKFDLDIERKNSFKEALKSTLNDISNKAQGIVSSFIKTGDDQLDSKISFRERQICLIAGSESCGKSKYVTYIVKGILDNNEDTRVLWFSMEDSKEQIVRSFISMKVMLTTKQLQSINYNLSDEDFDKINNSTEDFNDYKIEFVDQVSTIKTIMRKCRLFREKFRDDKIIVVIDNLGLIITDSFYKGIEKDDYLAGKIKEMSDMTNSSVFVLHHITKEGSKRFNIDEGYRPRKEYIKGSTRILDYVQQALLVNLPRKYKDLVSEELERSKIVFKKTAKGNFSKESFIPELWNINPQGDKYTKNIIDLQETTWVELKFVCATETLSDGNPIRAGYIIKKYSEYCLHVDELNKYRTKGFGTEKLSIYSFINSKKYKEDFSPKKDSRSYYLYGNNTTLCKDINSLFIVECVKNRDGSDMDEQNIIRYISNLDYNIFNPVENGKS